MFELQGTGNGRVSVLQHVSARNSLDLFTLHAEPWPPGLSSCFSNDSVPLWNVEHCLSSNEGSTQSHSHTHAHKHALHMHETHKVVNINRQNSAQLHVSTHTYALTSLSIVSETLIGPLSPVCLPLAWSISEFIDHNVWQSALLFLLLPYRSEKIPLQASAMHIHTILMTLKLTIIFLLHSFTD